MAVKCSDCGISYDYHLSACPECGSGDRHVLINDKVKVLDGELTVLALLKDYYQHNYYMIAVNVTISVGSIILGKIIGDFLELLIPFAVIPILWLLPPWREKIREYTRRK